MAQEPDPAGRVEPEHGQRHPNHEVPPQDQSHRRGEEGKECKVTHPTRTRSTKKASLNSLEQGSKLRLLHTSAPAPAPAPATATTALP